MQLVVGIDGIGLGGTIKISLRRIDVQVTDRCPQIIDVQAVRGQSVEVRPGSEQRVDGQS